MEPLNYRHLYIFWVIMTTGSIKAASVRLELAKSTISAQLSLLETSLRGKLFNRVGRNLEPTDLGHIVFDYAEKIFTTGQQLMNSVHSLQTRAPLSLRVGIVDVVPKLLTRKFLLPAMALSDHIHLICQEGKEENLLSELAVHNLDVVFADVPIRSGLSIKAYSHLLYECGVTFFGKKAFADSLQDRFPYSLDKAPMLLPMTNTALRGRIDQWFEKLNILPRIVGEFDDSALLKVFGQAGDGVFVSPQVIDEDIQQQYDVHVIGRSNEIVEKFYAISIERVIKHPAIVAISEAARNDLFYQRTQ